MSVTEQMMLYAEKFQQRSDYLEALVRQHHNESLNLLLKILEILEQIEYNKLRED